MARTQSPIGVSLIHIGSALLTLNLIAWACFGVPLRSSIWFLFVWVLGIAVAAIEPPYE